MIKRITSLILTLILLFQCIPLAYAVDTPDVNANAGGSGSGTSQTGKPASPPLVAALIIR